MSADRMSEPTNTPQTDQPSTALDALWTHLWDELRLNATGKPSGEAIIRKHRRGIEAEARAAEYASRALADTTIEALIEKWEPEEGGTTTVDDASLRHLIDVKAERDTLLAQNEALRAALERTLGNFRLLLSSKPVRDATETIAEAEAALAQSSDTPAPDERDATIGMLRSDLEWHHKNHPQMGLHEIGTRQEICATCRALTNTEPAARAWRESVEKPWREALIDMTAAYHLERKHEGHWGHCQKPRCQNARLLVKRSLPTADDVRGILRTTPTTSEAEATQRNEP